MVANGLVNENELYLVEGEDTITEDSLSESLMEKIDNAYNSVHSHTNKSVIDGITQADINTWSSSEGNAKSYTDAEIAKLSNVYDTKGSADAAQGAANDYTDEQIALLLNNSSDAVDSIYELRDAMTENADAIKALQSIASGHADKDHTHNNYASSVEMTGSGNAITAISQNGNKITATKGSTFLTAHPTITKSTDDTSTASPKHGETFTVVDNITRDSNGHVTNINTKTVTLPSETTLSKGTDTSDTKTLKHGDTFTAVTDTVVSGHKITDNNTTFTLPSETTLSKGTDTGGTTALKHGDSFTVTMNTSVNGHKITDNKMTFTLPTTTATTSASGLMSAADKLKVDESASVDYVKGLMTWGTF